MVKIILAVFLVHLFSAVSSLQVVKHDIPSGHVRRGNELGIVGGSNTTILKHPYQCSVIYYGNFFCACSIVNKNWVLTLATCIYGITEENYLIRVGSFSSADGGSLYSVQTLSYHPQYNVSNRDYDLGLLKLRRPLTFTKKINKVKLSTKNFVKNQKGVISGWGNDDVFQDLTVKGVRQNNCVAKYSPYNYSVTDSMFCASASDAGPCYKDFGDPLVNSNTLYGLFTWCFNCGDNEYPGVYTSVSSGISWINSVINT